MLNRDGVIVGQKVHRNICDKFGVLSPEEKLLMESEHQNKMCAGICIDDLAVVQTLSRGERKQKALKRYNQVLDAVDSMYEQVGLSGKVAKRQRIVNGGPPVGMGDDREEIYIYIYMEMTDSSGMHFSGRYFP